MTPLNKQLEELQQALQQRTQEAELRMQKQRSSRMWYVRLFILITAWLTAASIPIVISYLYHHGPEWLRTAIPGYEQPFALEVSGIVLGFGLALLGFSLFISLIPPPRKVIDT